MAKRGAGRPPGAKNKIPPYEYKHDMVKDLPKSFQQIADSAIDHIGAILNNTKATEIIEDLPLILCIYTGYTTFIDKPLYGAAYGGLAYKLATTPSFGIGGSQSAGLAMLGILGLVNVLGDVMTKATTDFKEQLVKGGITESEADLVLKVYRATQGHYRLSDYEKQAWEDYKKKYGK